MLRRYTLFDQRRTVDNVIMSFLNRDLQDNNSAEGHTANLSSVSSELTSLSGDKRPVATVNKSSDSQRQSIHKKKKTTPIRLTTIETD